MSGLLPVAVYGLKVPAGDVMVPSLTEFPATFRLTMAAIDPTAEPEYTGAANSEASPRATLKLIYDRSGPGDDEGDESEEGSDQMNFLQKLLRGGASDDDEDDSSGDDEEVNGGPSDPSKTKKARKQAAADALMNALAENVSDDEMDVDGANGAPSKKKNKGKAKALSQEDEVDSEDEEEDDADMEEVVVCTLDPSKNYQQPLDLTIGEDQRAYFKVSGTHAIYLTGNYVVPAESTRKYDHEHDYDDESMDYDLSPGEEDYDSDEEDESDELDNLDDPRITEVQSDEEEAPKLVKNEAATKKGKNKRPADELADEPASLDDIMAKVLKPEPATNGEPKLSKKQMKKLKNNAGKAVEAAVENKEVKKVDSSSKDASSPKADKKVQFAKNLEQGPSGAAKDPKGDTTQGAKEPKKETKKEGKAEAKAEATVNGETPKASLGSKTLQGGVKVDDKKLGTGPACKKGNKVGMRYIGKLKDGKVFDANKKGAPFTFKLGTGEVIKGWDIGVAGMSAGGERRIEVPANLAYGGKSMPGIPANSVLVFDVKLLTIN
ncbi:MAG: hypothetical protein LQ348_006440 [Seirophora lacunosa]|nr:MAG: hypothetical protein LQ348_006440 [Seirophora lacunosa]